MTLSIADIEEGRTLVCDFGAAFVVFSGTEAVFGREKVLFALSFGEAARSQIINNGSRVCWKRDPDLLCSYVDLTVSECGNGIAFKIEAMHDCFLDIKTDKNAIESINDGSEAFRARIGAATVKISGCCSLEGGRLKLRRGTSKLFISDITRARLHKNTAKCFQHEAHKVNELIFGGKELSESSPHFPYLLLSEGLMHGHFDKRLVNRLSKTAKLLSKKEKERAFSALERYVRAFGMPPLREMSATEVKRLTNTELKYARRNT